jgi:hypothetical protein
MQRQIDYIVIDVSRSVGQTLFPVLQILRWAENLLLSLAQQKSLRVVVGNATARSSRLRW